jgi:hypothetical protein
MPPATSQNPTMQACIARKGVTAVSLSYPGGKGGSGVYQQIINLMPPHAAYIEPFLGGGSVMRTKRPAPMANIGIDIDAAALQLFKASCPEIPGLELHRASALEWLAPGYPAAHYYTRPDTLIYLDPPYLMSTRSTKRPLYKYEFATPEEHEWLLGLIQGMRCMVMISGYWSELYADRLKSWRVISFQAQTRSGRTATEYVWCNFPKPLELHDYRFLGQNFRERERIKRKQARWKNRLLKMDYQERHAILAAIEELRSQISPYMTILQERQK